MALFIIKHYHHSRLAHVRLVWCTLYSVLHCISVLTDCLPTCKFMSFRFHTSLSHRCHIYSTQLGFVSGTDPIFLYSSFSCLSKSLRLHCLKWDWDEVCQDHSSIDRSWVLVWHQTFKMATMTSACHSLMEHLPAARWACLTLLVHYVCYSPWSIVNSYSLFNWHGSQSACYVLSTDYSDSRAVECINNDLVNTLCNLVSRCAARSLNPQQIFPDFDQSAFNHIALDSEQDIMTRLYELSGMF